MSQFLRWMIQPKILSFASSLTRPIYTSCGSSWGSGAVGPNAVAMKKPGQIGSLLQRWLMPASVNQQPVRHGVRVHYKPNAYQRRRKHGLEKRLSTRRGLIMLWRRKLKGRWSLST